MTTIHMKLGKDNRMYVAIDDQDEVDEFGYTGANFEFINVLIAEPTAEMNAAIEKVLASDRKYLPNDSCSILKAAAEIVTANFKAISQIK